MDRQHSSIHLDPDDVADSTSASPSPVHETSEEIDMVSSVRGNANMFRVIGSGEGSASHHERVNALTAEARHPAITPDHSTKNTEVEDTGNSAVVSSNLSPGSPHGAGLVPGLPDDLAFLCLLSVPRMHHCNMRIVCKEWQRLLQSKEFYEGRLLNKFSDTWIYVLSRSAALNDFSWRAFDSVSASWMVLPPMPNQRLRKAVGQECQVVSRQLIVCGGWQDEPLRDVSILDPRTNQWRVAAPMLCRRAHFVSGVIEDRLFVAGGLDGSEPRSRSAECYDVLKDEWTSIPFLENGLSFCTGVSLDSKLFFKAKGGMPKEIQVFSPELHFWSSITARMLDEPTHPHVVMDNYLYRADAVQLGFEIKAYEAETDIWRTLEPSPAIFPSGEVIKDMVAFDNKIWGISEDFRVVEMQVSRSTLSVHVLKWHQTGSFAFEKVVKCYNLQC